MDRLYRTGGKALLPLTKSLFSQLASREQAAIITENLLGAVKNNDGESALQMLELLIEAYLDMGLEDEGQETTNKKAYDRQQHYIWTRLRPLFWNIPPLDRFAAVRFEIVKHISGSWEPETTPQSILAFRFLIAVVSPRPTSWKHEPYESEDEITARTDALQNSKEREQILALIRERVSGLYWKREQLADWLEQPGLPEDIEQILATAFTHNTLRSHGFKRDLVLLKTASPHARETTVPRAIRSLQDILAIERLIKAACAKIITETHVRCKGNFTAVVDAPYDWTKITVNVHFPEEEPLRSTKEYNPNSTIKTVQDAIKFFFQNNPETDVEQIEYSSTFPFGGSFSGRYYKREFFPKKQ